jgi:hypothetical protein
VLLGYLSRARHHAAVDEPVQAEAQRLQDRARAFSTYANISFAVGGVAVLGGVTWALLSRKQDRGAPRIGIGVGSIDATWVFE